MVHGPTFPNWDSPFSLVSKLWVASRQATFSRSGHWYFVSLQVQLEAAALVVLKALSKQAQAESAFVLAFENLVLC